MSKLLFITGAVIIGSQLIFGASNVRAQDRASFVGSGVGVMPQFYLEEIVRNAPVAAKITTRSVQLLHDGNRIVHEDVTRLYRDSRGRVRRENLPESAGHSGFVSLSDPVQKRTFMLNAASKTAFKVPEFRELISTGYSSLGAVRVEAVHDQTAVTMGPGEIPVAGDITLGSGVAALPDSIHVQPGNQVALTGVTGDLIVSGGQGASSIAFADRPGSPNSGQTEIQPLGQDTIDGIRVEGTSYTTTYPADAFGNEQPIIVQKTTWFAPELRMMVRSEEKDPRFGTVTYQSEILSTDEPVASLFEIPPDFKVIQPGMIGRAAPVD